MYVHFCGRGVGTNRAYRIFFLGPNTNTNIFGMFVLTRIRIYSGSISGLNRNTNIFVIIKWTKYEYLNIFGLNIRILIDEYCNIPWNAAIGIKFCIPKIPRSQFKFA